jgi:Tfp pilus assembly protein PilX
LQLIRSLRLHDEHGIAMVMVVLLSAVLLLLSGVMIDVVQSDSTRSATSVQRGTALEAAEAGIDNYLSKLVDDNQYYLHDVAAGESTRQSGATTVAGSCSPTPTPAAWTGAGASWTYPNGKDQWCSLGNGYEFNLQITAPSAGSQVVDIVSTGRKSGTTNNYRILEVQVRPSSVADFQMLANADISYGSAATTYGKIYAGIDSSGVKHSINHQGTAYGNLYAEGSITGNPTLAGTPQAQEYDSSDIRTVIKQPINFSNFTTSLTDIKRAADLNLVGGQKVYDLNNTNYDVWKLTFNSNGTVAVQGCKDSGSNAPEDVKPTTCTTATGSPYTIPTNGAIYAQQSVMIADGTSTCGTITSGNCVNGRVTVASANDIIIGDDLDYVQTGDDVLGLIAGNEMIVAQWAPTSLNWRAATIAQTGQWRSAVSNQTHSGTMTFTGSTATNGGGYMSMYATRVYQYDSSLSYLQPPWFPTIDYAYTVLLYRELPAP